MNIETLEVLIIDPFMKTIIVKKIENSLNGLQHAIGDHNIELVNLEGSDIMYVDEEGIYRENQQYFLYKNSEGNYSPFSGKAVVLGDKGDGKNYSTESYVTDYLKLIEFKTIEEIRFILANQKVL